MLELLTRRYLHMQKEMYRRHTIFLLAFIIALILSMIGIWQFRDIWVDWQVLVYIAYVVIIFVVSFVYSHHELHHDQHLIIKMVEKHQIALAKIKKGSLYRIVRDTRGRKVVLWDIDITLYDQEMNKIETTISEKCSGHLTQIPRGYVYVTYDPKHPKRIFIIPNSVISAYGELQPIVESYEQNEDLRIKYLNAYYDTGIMLKSYEEISKEKKKGTGKK